MLPRDDTLFNGQDSHSSEPESVLYFPAAHGAHSPPSGPVKPASQTQSVTVVLAWGDVLPPGHWVHSEEPELALYVATAHGVHSPPSGPVKPITHWQSVTASLTEPEKLLAGHATHSLLNTLLSNGLYLPGVQAVHLKLPSDANASHWKPALHAQLLNIVLASAVKLASGHGVHSADPFEILYVSAAQGEHGPPSAPVYPKLQTHLPSAGLPAGEFELDGHGRHVDSDSAPITLEYVSALQFTHASEPKVGLYFPAQHMVHWGPEWHTMSSGHSSKSHKNHIKRFFCKINICSQSFNTRTKHIMLCCSYTPPRSCTDRRKRCRRPRRTTSDSLYIRRLRRQASPRTCQASSQYTRSFRPVS